MKLIYQSKPKIKFQNLSREEWIVKLSRDLKKIPGFLKAYFYGSFARLEDEPWSDVDIIIILENHTIPKSSFLDNLLFVSHFINDYPELEPIVYTISQWENIISDTNPIGFWKDVRKDLIELHRGNLKHY